jgi:hypothetical protein
MDVLGVKPNRKTIQVGLKQMNSGYNIGIKKIPKNENIAAKGNAKISEVDSRALESDPMTTGLDKSNNIKPGKNTLERSSRKRK